MNITITLKTDNAALEDDPGAEVSWILKQLADRFGLGGIESVTPDSQGAIRLRDSNGNTVGHCAIKDEPEPDTKDLVYVLTRLLQESRKPGKNPNSHYWMAYHLAQSALSKWNNAQ